MIKLVIYTENYFPGGLERFIFDLINGGLFDVHVIVNSENTRVVEFVKSRNINYSIIELSGFKLKIKENNFYNKFVKVFNFILHYFSMISNYFKIKTILKNMVNYENIMIVNGGYPAALSCFTTAIAAKKLGFTKVGLSVLSSPSSNYSNILFKLFQSMIDSISDKFIDFYIPNSKDIKFKLISDVNIDSQKINVVYTGVRLQKELEVTNELEYADGIIKRLDNDVWIAMVGLLGSTKRQDLLLEVITELDNQTKLILVGDGPNKEKLIQMALELGIQNRVVFTGWMDNPENIYRFVDMIVFLSDQEGLPYVISEAMSYKIPIIASSVGGIPEQIIDSHGGYIVDNNKNDVVKKIKSLKNNQVKQNEFINYSFKRVKNEFSITKMNQRILELYTK